MATTAENATTSATVAGAAPTAATPTTSNTEVTNPNTTTTPSTATTTTPTTTATTETTGITNPSTPGTLAYSVNDIFINYLGREADEEAINYYGNKLLSGDSLAEVTSKIAGSDEGVNYSIHHTPSANPTTAATTAAGTFDSSEHHAQSLNTIFINQLGREIDDGALTYYADQVATGAMTLDQIREAIATSPEAISRQELSGNQALNHQATNTAAITTVNANELSDYTNPDFQIPNTTGSVTSTQVSAPDDIGTVTYNAAQISAAQGELTPEAYAEAAIADLPPEMLVSSQMEELTAGIENDEIPVWAKPAADAVEAQLAARGLTRSSIGQAALTNAIISAALPLAQGNAAALQENFAQNLSNEQQANLANADAENQMLLANLANRQQALLANQAALNAAAQFNATSQNQTNQFMATLEANIDLNNAAREDGAAQFNATMEYNAQKFNAENATLIEQSNLQWQRQANTESTAAINAVNAQNVQNAYGLQAQSIQNLWQEARDAASWVFQSSETDKQGQVALLQSTISAEAAQSAASTKADATAYGAIGSAAYGIAKELGVFESAKSAIFG